MIDFSNILTRASSRLFIAFIVTIWACTAYTGLTWIFIVSFGIFALGYTITKVAGYHYDVVDDDGDILVTRDDLVDALGRFRKSEIGPLNKDV